MPRFLGAVLCGGASRRMGTAKALVEVDGVAMAARVAAALRGAGAQRVVLVGGDPSWSGLLDLPLVADRWPGEGPLGGLATALLGSAGGAPPGEAVVVVAACDQPWLDAGSLRRLVDALVASPEAVAAVATDAAGRRTPFPTAWRSTEGPRLEAVVAAGERRALAAFDQVAVVDVVLDPGRVADVDRPEDLEP